MADPFIGMVQAFGFHWPPLNWALCFGQYLQIVDYQALYALIGSQFGGDWRTVMATPDLRGRVNMGQGVVTGGSPFYYDWGQVGGTESVFVHPDYMAAHTHGAQFTPSGGSSAGSVQVFAGDGDKATPQSGYHLANAGGLIDPAKSFTDTPGTTVALGGVSGGGGGGGMVTLDQEGQQGYLDNMMPSQVVNWCIALEGEFPARN